MERVGTTPASPEDASPGVMLEYWLASKFGQLWLHLHKSLGSVLGEMPGECALFARGHQFSADRLYRVQRFAASVWWRVGMVAVALLFPVIGISALVRPGRAGTDVAVGIMILPVGVAAIAMLQMGLLSFRSGQIRWYLVKAGPHAADEPLPPGSLGLPTRWDFWVMLIVAVTVFGILLYAGTR
jgi:hypothetical protein